MISQGGRVEPLKVAVVGAGPSGLFAVEALTDELGRGVTVDVYDRLPEPYGLVRYGVAPDHPNIKSVVGTLQAILERDGVRFIGAVQVGTDVTAEDLHDCYDAVIYATGAPHSHELSIPGENLPGSVSAADLVKWYNAHPDAVQPADLGIDTVVVIGAGNVALDVGRVLTRDVEHLGTTDIPRTVLDVLAASRVKDVYLIARRSARFAKYTSKELRELDKIDSVAKVVVPSELPEPPWDGSDRPTAAKLDILRRWSQQTPPPAARRIHLRFGLQPTAIMGQRGVQSVAFERTFTDDAGRTRGTGEHVSIAAELVVRSVGYFGASLPALPFDHHAGVIPNQAGRVLDSGRPIPGLYVTGWIKRGPVGVIGSNKVDARETVRALVQDFAGARRVPGRSIESLLAAARCRPASYADWKRIERAETERGRAEGRSSSKIADWPTLREIAGAATAPHVPEEMTA
jgi:ferredoxin--NADP+ reductase